MTKTSSQRQPHHTRYILSDSLIDWEGINSLHSKTTKELPRQLKLFYPPFHPVNYTVKYWLRSLFKKMVMTKYSYTNVPEFLLVK